MPGRKPLKMPNSETSSITVAGERFSVESKACPTLDLVQSEAEELSSPRKSDELYQVDLEKVPTKPGIHDAKSFPDGGWKAWLVVSGAFCVMFCSFGWVNCE